MPKVSVIIPVYGVEKYIERCARSLFEQTLDDIEYLFIDDCTPDKSIIVLQQLLEEYPQRKQQVVIHRMEHNSGQAAVRKWGMQNATGEYVIHCDSDDWVALDMYRAMYEKAKSDNSDLVVCDFIVTDGKNVESRKKGCNSLEMNKFINSLLFQEVYWTLWNKMFRRNIYENKIIYPDGNMGEDMALTLQMVLNCRSFSYLDSPFYYYFSNPCSITKDFSELNLYNTFIQIVDNINVLLKVFEEKNLSDCYASGSKFLIWRQKCKLLPLVSKKVYRKLWRSTFPNIEYEMIIDRNQSYRDKLKCLVAIFSPNLLRLLQK